MKFYKREYEISRIGKFFEFIADIRFDDYEKLFPFLNKGNPTSFHCYGNPYVEGIEGYCKDGTTQRITLLEFRDALDRHWKDLKDLLNEGEDFSEYTEITSKGNEILTLKCRTITFQTGQCTICSFCRIWGRLK